MKRTKDLMKRPAFDFYSTFCVVFFVILIKGVSGSGDGQGTFFSSLLKSYIEETAAQITHVAQSETQFADTTMSTNSGQNIGQGGEENQINPETVQGNSIVSYEPVVNNYADSLRKNQVTNYEVQPGDLISFIASDFGVSVNSIIWSNNLKDADSISPGQVLKIPPVSGIIYDVKKGDTLSSIAIKYGVDKQKVIDFNNIKDDDNLKIGSEIIVPDGQIKQNYATNSSSSQVVKRFSYLPSLGDYFLIPTTGFNWGIIHGRNGVDIANSCGTPIYAAADGNVNLADISGWNGGYGKYIRISHPNGTETLYGHLSKPLVAIGDYVQKGQGIALMGTTGRSTGCHLHFEVHGAKNPLAKY